MADTTWNGVEVAPKSVVMQAAKEFAKAFSETEQYQTFEQAYYSFRMDSEAQSVFQEFQKKQASLKALIMLNAVSDADQAELQRLQESVYQQTSFMEYSQAQQVLIAFSQEIGDQLSQAIGLDLANACQSKGCCG